MRVLCAGEGVRAAAAAEAAERRRDFWDAEDETRGLPGKRVKSIDLKFNLWNLKESQFTNMEQTQIKIILTAWG